MSIEAEKGMCRHDALTNRERLLGAIWEGWRDGRPKSCLELAAVVGYKSVGALHLEKLEEQGWIARVPGLDRARVPGPVFGGLDRDGRPLRIIL